MHRALISPDAVHGDRILLTDRREVHHMLRVLRLRPGDPVECFDGVGRIYAGRLHSCTPTALTVAVEQRRIEPPPPMPVALAQALLPSDQFEWVLQKATELGVQRIVPMVTARTIARPSAGGASSRLLRWRRIVEAATAQCGRATLPGLEPPQPFDKVLRAAAQAHTLMPTLVEPGPPLREQARQLQGTKPVLVLIGPEGDFTPEEVASAKACGARPATLGRATLRSETAAVVALALLQDAVGAL